ncbi:hypothetical protein ACFU99_19065 [Streptomyces sp. NPDC057654]|uniref:hypothetical protein n=1 Tax=Streptomyces sp. NPDC057654 TaxID=3346196 RepID=UPI0036B6D04C
MAHIDIQEEILTLGESYLSGRTEWDERPAILVLRRRDGGGLEWLEWPVPATSWDVADAPTVLITYAELAAELDLPPLRVEAVAFRYEGFVISPESSPEAAETFRRRRAGGSVPRNEEIPGRAEQRVLNIRDVHGVQYLVTATRQPDGGAVLDKRAVYPVGTSVTGGVPHGLELLMNAHIRP